jgi:quercetin dioxygenase-like cupin family protein
MRYISEEYPMLVKHYDDIQAKKVEEGAKNTTIRWLIAEPEGADNFFMRLLEIGPGGNTPKHIHPWEHEVFVLDGTGKVTGENDFLPIRSGDAVFVPCGENHSFENTGRKTLKILCLIPRKK